MWVARSITKEDLCCGQAQPGFWLKRIFGLNGEQCDTYISRISFPMISGAPKTTHRKNCVRYLLQYKHAGAGQATTEEHGFGTCQFDSYAL